MKQRTILKRRFSAFGFLILLLFCTQVMHAQKVTITGTVTDNTGEPVPGVAVLVVGKKQSEIGTNFRGTTTDFDGNYSINVDNRNRNLVFTYMGFEKQVIRIGEGNVINAVLKPSVSQLNEVVVVGYGTQQRRDVTGSITKLKTEAIERTANATIEQALNGRIAGVNTMVTDGTPGSGIRIRIRGGTSINANNEPLYVIDGMPIEVDYANDSPSAFSGPSSSPLANLDPSSIASITVLKDASAAAIYGAQGANGVVLITTKSGRSDRSEITFDTSINASMVPESRFVDVLNTSEYGTLLINRELYENGILQTGVLFGEEPDLRTPEEEQARYDNLPQTNWQEELYRTGVISRYSLNATGGNDKNLYAIGGTYFKNEGAIVNSFFKRYNFNVNLQNKLTDKLKIRTVLNPSYSAKEGATSGGDFTQSKMGIVIRALTRKTDRGIGIDEDESDPENGVWVDPLTEAKNAQNHTNVFSFVGNTNISYKISDKLTGSVRLGTKISDNKQKNYYTKLYGRGVKDGGLGTRFHSQNISWNNQNMLTYKTSFGDKIEHKLNVMGVFEQTYRTRESEYIAVTDFPIETIGFNALHTGKTPLIPQTFKTESFLKSYLARVNYGINNTYNLTLSMRADGSSRFGAKNKWGYFPAAGFSWNMHKEKFLKNVDVVSDLKLRLSYGQTGNQGIPAYASWAVLEEANTVFGSEIESGLAVQALPNSELKWEFTDQYDVGVDAGFFDNRLNFVFDAYYKKTTDLLLLVPLKLSSGFKNRMTNIGNVENKGIEIAINTINLEGAFNWTTDFTFSMNENKVLGLGGATEQLFEDQFTGGRLTGVLRVGESLGNWIGLETNGVFSFEDFDENGNLVSNAYGVPASLNSGVPILGDVKHVNQDGDVNANGYPVINDKDMTIIARTNPKHFGSMYNNFSYKGFNLGLLLTYKYGFDVINGNKHRMLATGYGQFNKTGDMRNAWTPINRETNVPRADYNESSFTDRFVEDGSFIRLQSVNMSYNLPSKSANKIGFNSVKIYSNIENLFIWTKYTGYDPEVSVSRGQRAITSQNLDYGAYPRTLNVSLGVKVGF